MRVWDAKSGNQLRELHGHTDRVTSVSFSPDGNQIVSGSDDRSVRVWDAKSGKELQGHTGRVASVSFSPGGNQVVSGSYARSVRVCDAKSGERMRELHRDTNSVRYASFSPDGDQASSNRSLRVWDNLNPDASWIVNQDGWILSSTLSERLAWVPSTISSILLRPHNTLILSPSGSATISFTRCKLGTSWHECYTPSSGCWNSDVESKGDEITS